MDENGIKVLVRFAPDGTVIQIGERPEGATPQAWFDHLTRHAGEAFRALAGGRGVFRLAPERVRSLREAWAGGVEAVAS